jgi:serine protease Do
MTESTPPAPPMRKILSARRAVILASVAGLGIAAVLAGPLAYLQLTPSDWLPSALAAENAVQPVGFADLIAKVKPAVISVRVKIEADAKATGSGQNDNALPFQPGSPFYKFYRQFGLPNVPNGTPNSRLIITGEGSGFFVSADGYAVTNYHVVDHATSVQVTADDGKSYTAKVIGSDQRTDLALIKIDGGNGFPYVKLAKKTPRVGDWVVAVGNPFGLGGTVTAGIVSARGRDIGAGPYDDFIQIDAPINKGNSGGPTFNINGNVIGVNTAIYSPSGGSIGIGFAIPADTVKTVIAQLKDKGVVTRGWIGVQIQPINADIADSLGLKKAEGALVDEPQPGSPAAKAGIIPGDVITAVDGTPVKDARDLAKNIAALAPGTSATLNITRNGEEKTLSLTLGELPNERQAHAGTKESEPPVSNAQLGLTLAPAANMTGAGTTGVVVTAVDPDGVAAEHGLHAGDVILDIGSKAVSTPSDVRKELSEVSKEGRRTVLMRVKSGENTVFVALRLKHA